MADRRQSRRAPLPLSERGVTVWIRTGERRSAIFSTSKQLLHHSRPNGGEAARVPSSQSQPRTLEIANLEIRPDELQVLVEGNRAGLTVREFELFLMLAERLDVLVRKVRHKLELAAPDWRYIHTHFGIGYRFSPERLSV
jgi:DNA-binding response OmpR family regulator